MDSILMHDGTVRKSIVDPMSWASHFVRRSKLIFLGFAAQEEDESSHLNVVDEGQTIAFAAHVPPNCVFPLPPSS